MREREREIDRERKKKKKEKKKKERERLGSIMFVCQILCGVGSILVQMLTQTCFTITKLNLKRLTKSSRRVIFCELTF